MELKINGLGTSQWQGGEEGGWDWAPPNLKQTENFLLLVLKLDGKQSEQCRTLMENVQSLRPEGSPRPHYHHHSCRPNLVFASVLDTYLYELKVLTVINSK